MRTRRLLAAVAAGSLILTMTTDADAAEPPKPGAVKPAGPTAHWITLITGDKVLVRSQPGQPDQITFMPAKGSSASGAVITRGRSHTYAVPTTALHDVAAGRLDRTLFDVTTLIAERYDDAHTKTLPVIVSYAGSPAAARTRAARDRPSGAQRTRVLNSIGARSVAITKASGSAFWKSVNAGVRLESTVRTIRLDRRVRAVLDGSVPQVGAPAAWQRGYTGRGVKVAVLDTGIDTNHPDLTGKVAESANFSESPDTTDHFGHGTHVAGTIAGTGAASDGKYRGVAPDATLLNGKVLSDDGYGTESGIVSGMEWATAQGAKVINLSLGGGPTDGTDPMSQAVNTLSQQTRALFVIAAGNDGPFPQTVGSPGSADAALTVGAVGRDDTTAEFSSRGPRKGDFALKPEIAGPGVGIVAARAAGTEMGEPVGEHYTAASGTSMATPHVAGAAALLAQAQPDWAGDQLRTRLISTANPHDTVTAQGAGRVDADRATDQTVRVDTAEIEFGFLDWPHPDPAPVTKAVTYRNPGSTPMTLDLAAAMDPGETAPAPTFSTRQLVVPAGGQATVEVTARFDPADIGPATGRLTATSSGGGRPVVTTFGWYVSPELYDLTITGTNPDGSPATAFLGFDRLDGGQVDFDLQFLSLFGGKAKVRVPPAPYSVSGTFVQPATDSEADTLTLVVEPEFVVTKDATVTLDARGAKPVSLAVAGQPDIRPRETSIAFGRKGAGGLGTAASMDVSVIGDHWNLLTVPSAKPTIGSAAFSVGTRLELPAYRARVLGGGVIPVLDALLGTSFTGTKTLETVDAGTATPAELAGVRGKLALIRVDTSDEVEARARAADTAGAAALMFYNLTRPGFAVKPWWGTGVVSVPAVSITRATANQLLELLRERQVKVRIDGVAASPFAYDLVKSWGDRIPAVVAIRAGQSEFAQVREVYGTHADQAGVLMREVRIGRTPRGGIHGSWLLPDRTAPFRHTSYVLGGPVRWSQTLIEHPPVGGGFAWWYSTERTYRAGQRAEERWFTPVATSDVRDGTIIEAAVWRERDWLSIALSPFAHGGVQLEPSYVPSSAPGRFAMTVSRNGEVIGTADAPIEGFVVPTDAADYRIELDAQRDLPWWRYSTRIRTTWDFHSAGGDDLEPLPLIAAGVEVPQADLFNKVKAGKATTIKLGLRHQANSKASGFTSAKLEISYDGSTWTELPLTPAGDARYTATVAHPVSQAGKAVHLRIEAQDQNGGRLAQEVTRAYGLTR